MKSFFRILILGLVLAAGAAVARADVYQVIRVNVQSRGRIEVNGSPTTFDALPAAIAELARGDRRVAIELYLPLGVSKASVKRIMDLCRQAGASTFQVAYKS